MINARYLNKERGLLTSWTKAELEDLRDLEAFLIKQEEYCVGFSAWLREKISATPHLRDFLIFIKRQKDHASGPEAISEAILITEQGLVYPVLHWMGDSLPHGYRELALRLQPLRQNLNSLIGPEPAVNMTEKLINMPLRASVDYYLMLCPLKNAIADITCPKDIKIRQASVADALTLFDLQKSYELEEVYLNPQQFNDTACYAYLKTCLRKEIVFVAERNGRPIAKAGTNARGYQVWQIGGVFTTPSERGKGLATLLMKTLLNYLHMNKKRAVLFVKKNNEPAIKLYKNLGFKIIADFKISYLQK